MIQAIVQILTLFNRNELEAVLVVCVGKSDAKGEHWVRCFDSLNILRIEASGGDSGQFKSCHTEHSSAAACCDAASAERSSYTFGRYILRDCYILRNLLELRCRNPACSCSLE